MATTGRQNRVGAIVLTALALGGCAAQSCTTLGCESAVSVDVSAVQGLGASQAGRVKVCVGSAPSCQLALAPRGQKTVRLVFPDGTLSAADVADGKPVSVAVTVMNPGQLLVEESVTTTFATVAPNGTSCGPVCYTASLVATDRGVSSLPLGASPTSSG